MTDPIEAHLFFLLQADEVITLEDVCWWDSNRAERVCRAAGLEPEGASTWTPGTTTERWMTSTWEAIRNCS